MSEVKLPIVKPPIDCFNNFAYPLSVIFNNKAATSWFYSNFIQIRCRKNFLDSSYMRKSELKVYFYRNEDPRHYPCFDYGILLPQCLEMEKSDVVEAIKKILTSGYYVITQVDEFFIPPTNSFQRRHFRHDIMVFGFDDANRKFLVSTRDANQRLIKYEVPFALFYDAYLLNEEIFYFRMKKDWQSVLDLDLIREFTEEYLQGKNSTKRFASREEALSDTCYAFGVEVYDYIIQYLGEIYKENTWLDIRNFQLLWEHKKVSLERVYYIDKLYKRHDLNMISNFKRIEKDSLIIRNLILKYKFSNSKDMIKKSVTLIEKLRRNETQALEEFLKVLSHKM